MDGRQNKTTNNRGAIEAAPKKASMVPSEILSAGLKTRLCSRLALFTSSPDSSSPPCSRRRVSPPRSPPSAALNAKATRRAAAELPHPITASCLTPKTGGQVVRICSNNVISSYMRWTEAAKLAAVITLDQQRKHFPYVLLQNTRSRVHLLLAVASKVSKRIIMSRFSLS